MKKTSDITLLYPYIMLLVKGIFSFLELLGLVYIIVLFNLIERVSAEDTTKTTGTQKIQLTADERAWLKTHKVIRLGVNPEWPPIEFINEKGLYSGIVSDYMRLISQRIGLRFEVVSNLSWSEALSTDKKKEIDVWPAIMKTASREKNMYFTQSYLNFPVMIFGHFNSEIINFNKLEGKRILLIKDYAITELFKEQYPYLNFQEVDTVEEALQSVSQEKSDVFMDNLVAVDYLINKYDINNVRVVAPTPYSYELRIGVRKELLTLVAILDKVLNSFTQPEGQAIERKWLARRAIQKSIRTTEIKHSFQWDVLLIGICLLLLLLLFRYRKLAKEGHYYRQIEQKLYEKNKESQINGRILNIMLTQRGTVIYSKVLKVLLEAFDVQNGFFGYLQPDNNALVCPSITKLLYKIYQMETKEGLYSWRKNVILPKERWTDLLKQVILEKKTVFKNIPHTSFAKNTPIGNAMGAPILYQDQLLGVIYLTDKLTYFTETDKELLENTAKTIATFFKTQLEIEKKEQERERAEEALKNAHFNLENIFNASTPVCVVDKNFKVIRANEAYYSLFNLSIEEDVIDFPCYNEKTEFSCLTKNCPLVRLANQEDIIEEQEITKVRKDGSLIRCILTARPFRDAEGQLVGIVESFRDITEQKKTEEALKIAKEAAELANRAKSEFLANMSHEIRTPLNAILGFTEILVSQINEPKQKNYLESIQSSGKSLLSLINDILDLSKVEAGKLKVQYMPVELQQLFTEIKQIFLQKIANKQLEFITDIDSNLPSVVLLDETRLRQILLNLMGNAIKFTEAGYIKLSVQSRYLDEEHHFAELILCMEDTGIGIPEEQHDTIFGAFVQQHNQKYSKHAGTGLGLAITKRLVEVMEGEISLTSAVGQGSTFKVVFDKVAVVPETDLERLIEKINIKNIKFEESTILVVDDFAFNRKVVKGYLDDYSTVKLIEAENGQEGVELARNHHPDLILMDMKMPVMDGYQASQIIKQDEKLKHIPIVALTASAMTSSKQDIMTICNAYVTKPVARAELITILTQFLPHSIRSQEENQKSSKKNLSVEICYSKETFNDVEVTKLFELFELLRMEFQEKWQTISDTLTINEVEDFGKEIKELGEKYHCNTLASWGNTLHSQATLFNMDDLPKTLEEFPTLLKNMQEMLGDYTPNTVE